MTDDDKDFAVRRLLFGLALLLAAWLVWRGGPGSLLGFASATLIAGSFVTLFVTLVDAEEDE